MNKMIIIAAIFNKQLNEIFVLKYDNTLYTAYFSKNGLQIDGHSRHVCDKLFKLLLLGKATIN